jgi:hypothetical protein
MGEISRQIIGDFWPGRFAENIVSGNSTALAASPPHFDRVDPLTLRTLLYL